MKTKVVVMAALLGLGPGVYAQVCDVENALMRTKVFTADMERAARGMNAAMSKGDLVTACRHAELGAHALELLDEGRTDACRRLQYQLVPDLAVQEAKAWGLIPGVLASCRRNGHL